MLHIITRREWGASPLKTPTSMNIKPSRGGTAIHWEGERVGDEDHSKCAARVRGIQRFHIRGRGWADIAYTYLVCQHGSVYEGRGPGHRTAANGTDISNDRWYAVCALVGPGDRPTPELLAAIRVTVEHLREHGGAGNGVTGHRDHKNTDCPGAMLYAWLAEGMPPDWTPERDHDVTRPVWPGRVLEQGMTGSDVRIWQSRLRRLGYEIDIDGDFGPQTKGATERWQKRHGQAVDGIVNESDWLAAW